MQRILVIDDSQLVSRLLNDALLEAGYQVTLAHDADSGYRQAIAVRPDLILLDVNLPDVTGYELLRVLRGRAELEHVPIIMITGTHNRIEHKLKGFQGGADDYVLKPFEMSELLERMKALLRRAQARPAGVPPSAPAAQALEAVESESPVEETIPLRSLVARLLLEPRDVFPTSLPSFALLFLLIASGLTFTAMALAAGPMPKPAIVGLAILGIWGLLVTIVTVTCSIAGLSLKWRDAATLVSLSCIPMLLHLSCALIFSAWTTLSPFIFNASLSLFTSGASILRALDLFTFWSAFLLQRLLSSRTGIQPKTAWFVSGLIWAIGSVLLLTLGRLS